MTCCMNRAPGYLLENCSYSKKILAPRLSPQASSSSSSWLACVIKLFVLAHKRHQALRLGPQASSSSSFWPTGVIKLGRSCPHSSTRAPCSDDILSGGRTSMCGRRCNAPTVNFEKNTRLLQRRLLIDFHVTLSRKRLCSEELQQNCKQLWITVNK